MPWYNKEQKPPFDAMPAPGLFFLDGDMAARRYGEDWTKGKTYPLMTFPSGVAREISPGSDPAGVLSLHIWGALDLPYTATRDQAYDLAQAAASKLDYQVVKQGVNALSIVNAEGTRAYHLVYEGQQLVNILHAPKWAMELLDGESRAVLPPLYSTEKQGGKAVAPVKFFTPDAGWSWYPTEFDGKDLFFGLVSGLEVELGYFSLGELESVRGGLGLPIERDLYFTPTPLDTLRQQHQS
jgi:Protein of unknown function (DUF2958)